MARVLLTWELGSNLGHLTRLLPIAKALKARGHQVLLAVKDMSLARLFPAERAEFVQAPQLSRKSPDRAGVPASYADLLWLQGWNDHEQLSAQIQAWKSLMRSFRADAIVLDHSPTVLAASQAMGLPRVVIGTGFELPPMITPLPAFPGFAGATHVAALAAEERTLDQLNRVFDALEIPRLQSLQDLFKAEGRWLTTFAELDHYGPRPTEEYVGPIGEFPDGAHIEWPNGHRHRIFAYLRPSTPLLREILAALSRSDAAVICCVPNVPPEILPRPRPGFVISSTPVQLAPLWPDTDLCVSYAPAGIVAASLLHGVPQMLSPAHVEAQLTAHRVSLLGAGTTLVNALTEEAIGKRIAAMLAGFDYKARVRTLAARHARFSSAESVRRVADHLDLLLPRRSLAASASH